MDETRPGHFEVRTLTSLAEIDAIADDWRALEDRCCSRLVYFQTHGWCRAWIAAHAGEARGIWPRVATIRRAGRLVAVWPLMLAIGAFGVRKLLPLGEPHSQYCNILADVAPDDAEILDVLLDGLLDAENCDIAVFRSVPAASRLTAALDRLPRLADYANESSVLDLTAFRSSEDYAEKLGRKQRQNRARRRKNLARLGDLGFEVVWPDDPRFAALAEAAVAMKRRWLAETGRLSAGAAMAEMERFLSGLTGDRSRLRGACLSVLRAGGRLVAIEIGFLCNGHYCAYLGAFDWDLRDLSPGKVQMEMTVAWLIDNRLAAYDLLANPTEYKTTWSNDGIALLGFAAPLTWKGRLYGDVWLPKVLPAVKRAYYALPSLARRFLTAGQSLGCMILAV